MGDFESDHDEEASVSGKTLDADFTIDLQKNKTAPTILNELSNNMKFGKKFIEVFWTLQ